jgi:beta-glucanase (GH16 family)
MMKQTFLSLCIFLAALTLSARELPINGTFQVADYADLTIMPSPWMINQWSGYKPLCSIEVIRNGGITGNSVRMYNVTSSQGAGINSDFHEVRSGDTVRATFRARGKGKARFQVYFKSTTNAWVGLSPNNAPFVLSENWKKYTLSIPVTNVKVGETGHTDLAFELDQNSEMEISDLVIDVVEGRYRGELAFPDKWQAFGPISADFQPSATELTTMPETLNGLSPVSITRSNHTLDLGDLLTKSEQCAWLFAELDTDFAITYTIGAGADWWMQWYVNGEVVLDTLAAGNGEAPFAISNHVVDIPLKSGTNILAVKFLRGSSSATIQMGGPLELAKRSRNMKFSRIAWIEDFNDTTVECTGEPTLITGYPAPGLLATTGQGVFQTSNALVIEPTTGTLSSMPETRDDSRALGVRVQNFGDPETAGTLSLVFQNPEGKEFRLDVDSILGQDTLALTLHDDDETILETTYSKEALPAEFLLCGDAMGRVDLSVTSLSGGESLAQSLDCGFFTQNADFQAYLELSGDASQATLDNVCLGEAQEKSQYSNVPFLITPQKEFDPAKEGWELVFEDDFDGDEVDMTKWKTGWTHSPGYHTVKDGILTIKCDWADDAKTTQASSYFITQQRFLYGYFEWRGRFKTQTGWWSAFWLYGETDTNAFYDGFEIDIYEDYYLSPLEEGKAARGVLDHNLHILTGSNLKSWNYNGPKLEDPTAYTTIGCKWTPFEISYYMNGKLIKSQATHSPYDSVTFDPFNHACGLTPLQVHLSSQINRKSTAGPTSLGTYPDYFYTDYVKVYAYPGENLPQIAWSATPDESQRFSHEGDTLHFSAEVSPNADTQAAIRQVYLFDSGFLLDHKSQPPYDFTVRLTDEYYNTTNYVNPGRQDIVPDFRDSLHAYSILVQDELGNVSHTEPWIMAKILTDDDKEASDGTPYSGTPAAIPGTISLPQFDLGGEGVAYHDTTSGNAAKKYGFRTDEDVDTSANNIGTTAIGEWLNYTVDIAKEGDYEAVLHYGTPYITPLKVLLLLDGYTCVGDFTIYKHDGETADWGCTKTATAKVHLPAGRHVLKVYLMGTANLSSLNINRL